jgi:hypothetical protein
LKKASLLKGLYFSVGLWKFSNPLEARKMAEKSSGVGNSMTQGV